MKTQVPLWHDIYLPTGQALEEIQKSNDEAYRGDSALNHAAYPLFETGPILKK